MNALDSHTLRQLQAYVAECLGPYYGPQVASSGVTPLATSSSSGIPEVTGPGARTGRGQKRRRWDQDDDGDDDDEDDGNGGDDDDDWDPRAHAGEESRRREVAAPPPKRRREMDAGPVLDAGMGSTGYGDLVQQAQAMGSGGMAGPGDSSAGAMDLLADDNADLGSAPSGSGMGAGGNHWDTALQAHEERAAAANALS